MLTPYDWQEGIGNRAQYIEGKLEQGAPVLALSRPEGILFFTYRRQARKIYEIYDRLIFAGIGQQSDVDAIRNAALEFASREGFQRSEEDVTVQRVVTAMSAPLKRAFGDFGSSPAVARSLFAEVGETPEDDIFFVLDYDGDYAVSKGRAAVAGSLDTGESLDRALSEVGEGDLEATIEALRPLWTKAVDAEGERGDAVTDGLTLEAALMDRRPGRENRFRLLHG
jgi:proteasome alpha subunit